MAETPQERRRTKRVEEEAQRLYGAYAEAVGYRSPLQGGMPLWRLMEPRLQEAWREVARKALGYPSEVRAGDCGVVDRRPKAGPC